MSNRPTLWYRFIRVLARKVVFGLIGKYTVVGQENIPVDGPVIIAPIHVSHLDPMAVPCAMSRPLTFMAKEELFKVPVLGWLIRSLGSFPVRRGENDTDAIRKAIEILNGGNTVLIFPEGTRGDGKTLQPISPGAAMLAKRTGAQVVPVGIAGTHIAFPKGQKRIKRAAVTVVFGRPFRYDQVASASSEKENRALFARRLSEQIAMLCQQGGLDVRTDDSNQHQPESCAGPASSALKDNELA